MEPPENSPPCDVHEYQRIVGSLIHCLKTRPDIYFNISVLAQSMALRYFLTLGRPDNGSVLARSMKIGTITTSSTEAEWMALSHLIHDLQYVSGFLEDIGYEVERPHIIYCDSDAARQMADQPTLKRRSRHISIRYRLISRSVRCMETQIIHIAGIHNPADLLVQQPS